MTEKHTPGPWYLRTNRHSETDGRPWGWLDTKPPGSGSQSIPQGVNVTWTRGETSEANARLIAAAPDLYDAADMALNTLIGCCVSAGGVDDRKTILEAQAMLRAALAKATVEPSHE